MNLLRHFIVNTLSASLILIPVSGTARATEVERSPLYYRVQKGDSLSEVLDHLLLRPIYPLTGSLRRTIAANPGRFRDLEAQVFAGEKIYFSRSDEIMLRENNEVMASGEVRIGRRPVEVHLSQVAPAPEKRPAQHPVPPAAPVQELKKAPVEAAVVQPAQPQIEVQPKSEPVVPTVAQRQEPESERDPEEVPNEFEPARAPVPKKSEPLVQAEPAAVVPAVTAQTFPAKVDEEGVVKDAFVIKHSPDRPSDPGPSAFQAVNPLFSTEPRKVGRKPASETSEEPLERDNYFPMGESPISAPRPSDTKTYQSDF
jgi:hypothetical protein